MKLKKLVSLLMVAGMGVGLLAGCGSSSEEDVIGSASADEEYSDEVTDIEFYVMTLYDDDGVEEVEDAINAITEEEIGVHVNITMMDMTTYTEQISLMFSSGETIDLMLTTPMEAAGFSSLVSQGQLQPMNDLLEEYAPETLELMEDYLPGTTIDDEIYAVTTYRTLNSDCYVVMREDILEDLGLVEAAEEMDSWSDYEEILQAVVDSDYDNGAVTTALGNNNASGTVISVEYAMVGEENWEDCYGYDSLGDTYKIIAVDEETDTVYDYFESEEYYNMLVRMTDMYNAGYIYKDAATAEDSSSTLLANDVAFSIVVNSETGVEASYESSTGYPIVATQITTEPLSTGSATKFAWAIPTTAEEPEAAAKFLNLMYTNEEIENLLVWGIEGRDYELNDEGEAVVLDTQEYQSSDFIYGNQFLAYPAEGQGGDFRETSEEALAEAEISPYFGCTVDTSDVSNELTAVYNVIQEYMPGYESGSVSVPDTYEEYYNGDFCQALRDAGVDTVLECYQTQLDEFLAAE